MVIAHLATGGYISKVVMLHVPLLEDGQFH